MSCSETDVYRESTCCDEHVNTLLSEEGNSCSITCKAYVENRLSVPLKNERTFLKKLDAPLLFSNVARQANIAVAGCFVPRLSKSVSEFHIFRLSTVPKPSRSKMFASWPDISLTTCVVPRLSQDRAESKVLSIFKCAKAPYL